MMTMILCWVLYSKAIIGIALPIISTVLFALEIALAGVKAGLKARDEL